MFFTKRLRLRPIELRFFLVGGLLNRTSIPTLPGTTERVWKTRKILILRVIFRDSRFLSIESLNVVVGSTLGSEVDGLEKLEAALGTPEGDCLVILIFEPWSGTPACVAEGHTVPPY